MRTLLLIGLTSVVATGCVGGSAKRISALEAQVKTLSAPDGPAAAAKAWKADVAATTASHSNTIKSLEQAVESLTQQVQALMAANRGDEATAPIAAGTWGAVRQSLSVDVPGVTNKDNTYTVSRSWLLNQLSIATKAKRGLKLIPRKGSLLLRGVRPSSIPAALGLKNGDMILTIGGTKVAQAADVVDALQKAGDGLEVTFKRGREQQTFTYKLMP